MQLQQEEEEEEKETAPHEVGWDFFFLFLVGGTIFSSCFFLFQLFSLAFLLCPASFKPYSLDPDINLSHPSA